MSNEFDGWEFDRNELGPGRTIPTTKSPGRAGAGIGPEPSGNGLDRLDGLVQHGLQQAQGLQGFRGGAENGLAIGAVHFPQGTNQVGQGDAFGDGFTNDAIDLSGDEGGGGGGHSALRLVTL